MNSKQRRKVARMVEMVQAPRWQLYPYYVAAKRLVTKNFRLKIR